MLKELLKQNKVLFAPSALSADFANIERDVNYIKSMGADLLHLDVMDGVYVNNITFGMPMVAAIKKVTNLPLDVHLMITKPEKYINDFIASGADIITFHPDASDNPLETLKMIKAGGAQCGIALNPNIELDNYLNLLPLCDMVLVMSVYAGHAGQSFIEDVLKKVEKISKVYKIPVEIDGGVNENTAILAKNAGANILVAGSAFFKAADPRGFVNKIKS
jgi:ribulose-phosphate 3-epimerase